MEKTKKLFAYVVVFVAIVSLFLAGISMQSMSAYADLSPNTDVSTGVREVTDEDGYVILDMELIFLNTATTPVQRETIITAQEEVKNNNFSQEVLDSITEIAREIANDNEVDASAFTYAKPFLVENLYTPAIVTFATNDIPDVIDFILFKSDVPNSDWVVIELEEAANGAMNLSASEQMTITVKLPGSGTVVFAHYSPKKAEQAKADKEKENKPCCDDCKDCPFCSFLCKDGKCYCWTMYLVIALCAILIVLVIALIIVKSKAKKIADVQNQPDDSDDNVIEEERPEN